MQAYLDVPSFFSNVYLVDLSPSLCEVARKRFDRLGWKNVTVVCQDARAFRLEVEESSQQDESAITRHWDDTYRSRPNAGSGKADLVTMSYSLSMIPGMDQCPSQGDLSVLSGTQTSTPLSTLSRLYYIQGESLGSVTSTVIRVIEADEQPGF